MSKKNIDVESLECVKDVFYSLPLYKRLTEKERHKYRVMMKMALLSPFPTCDRMSLSVTNLIDIFGQKMFSDIIKLYDNGQLTKQTKV